MVMFVNLHAGRCGSTVLGQLENEHPEIHNDGEIFRAWYGEKASRARAEGRFVSHRWNSSAFYPHRPLDYIAHCAGERQKPIYGFEMKFMQLRFNGFSSAQFVRACADLGAEHFICLERRNYLRIVVSALVGYASKRFHLKSDQPTRLVRVHVDLDAISIEHDTADLITHLDRYARDFDVLKRDLENFHHLRLTYEDDVEVDPRVAFERVREFLGARAMSAPRILLKRINPFPLSDIVTNFPALRKALDGTSYAWMLDD